MNTRFKKNYSSWLLVFVLVASFLAGCTSTAQPTTVQPESQSDTLEKPEKLIVALVLNTSDYQTAGPLVQQWSQETGIPVEIIEENTTTYISNYVLAGRTGNPKVDVIMFWDFYLDQLVPMLTPLDGSEDPAVALSEEEQADFLSIGLSEYQGHNYIMPFSLDTRLFYYRTDLLEEAGYSEPPKTWDELVEVAQALTKDLDGDGNIDQWGFVSLGAPGAVFNSYTFIDFLFQKGGELYDENGRPVFNSPEGVEALQFMVDLRNKYNVMPPDMITYDNNEVHEGFLAGRFAMANHWPYMYGQVAGTELEGEVGYTSEPAPEGGQSRTVFNRWGFGIPKLSENKEAAWDLLKYLTSTQAGLTMYEKQLDWPLRASVYASPEVETIIPERHRLFSEEVFQIASESSISVTPPRSGETGEILGGYIDKAMVGDLTTQEALDGAANDIIALLEQ